jgi:hypothetical protein
MELGKEYVSLWSADRGLTTAFVLTILRVELYTLKSHLPPTSLYEHPNLVTLHDIFFKICWAL